MRKAIVMTRKDEKTTDIVLEYIDYLNGDFCRIHSEDIITNLDIEIGNNSKLDRFFLNFEGKKIEIESNLKMWYRRGDFSYRFPISDVGLNPKVHKYLTQEWEYVKRFLHDNISILGNYYSEFDDNKLKDLCLARECGLRIPETLVTGRKAKLEEFFSVHKSIITKPIHNGHINFFDGQHKYSPKGVFILSEYHIQKANDEFCLSMFQEYIEKKFEIRLFFIEKDLHPMAIFSQLDEQTIFDYRNYNRKKPNRNVPFKLPMDVQANLIDFIEKSNLTTGSIDLIFSTDENYYFLEVNPVGQFGWVSSNCNYYLEKKIATFLLKQAK